MKDVKEHVVIECADGRLWCMTMPCIGHNSWSHETDFRSAWHEIDASEQRQAHLEVRKQCFFSFGPGEGTEDFGC